MLRFASNRVTANANGSFAATLLRRWLFVAFSMYVYVALTDIPEVFGRLFGRLFWLLPAPYPSLVFFLATGLTSFVWGRLVLGLCCWQSKTQRSHKITVSGKRTSLPVWGSVLGALGVQSLRLRWACAPAPLPGPVRGKRDSRSRSPLYSREGCVCSAVLSRARVGREGHRRHPKAARSLRSVISWAAERPRRALHFETPSWTSIWPRI